MELPTAPGLGVDLDDKTVSKGLEGFEALQAD
jgi:hypothetical protein